MRNFQVSARPLHSSARNVIGSPDQSPDISPLKSWWFETVEIARQIERDRFTDVWNRVLAVKSFKPLKLEISDAGTGASSMASPCGTHRAILHMHIAGAKLGMCNDGVHGHR